MLDRLGATAQRATLLIQPGRNISRKIRRAQKCSIIDQPKRVDYRHREPLNALNRSTCTQVVRPIVFFNFLGPDDFDYLFDCQYTERTSTLLVLPLQRCSNMPRMVASTSFS